MLSQAMRRLCANAFSKRSTPPRPPRGLHQPFKLYLLNDQGKHTRVGEVTITNCVSTDGVGEISATQQLNTRAQSDRTDHLLISFRAGDDPDSGDGILRRLLLRAL